VRFDLPDSIPISAEILRLVSETDEFKGHTGAPGSRSHRNDSLDSAGSPRSRASVRPHGSRDRVSVTERSRRYSGGSRTSLSRRGTSKRSRATPMWWSRSLPTPG